MIEWIIGAVKPYSFKLPNLYMAKVVYVFMKKIVLLLMSLNVFANCFSQHIELNDFNNERRRIDKTAFKVIGTYSAANIIYGSIAASQAQGSNKYFHQMNAIWNGITLGITAIGHFTKKNETGLSFSQSLKKQHSTEKLFLLNAGLDLAYIAGGAYINEKSKTTLNNRERLKGYGRSIMLQGAVLLLFDGVVYAIHNRHGKKLHSLADRLQLAATRSGIGISVRL